MTRELTLFKELRGVSHGAEHRIIMRDDKPLKKNYPRNPGMQSVIEAQVDELLLVAMTLSKTLPIVSSRQMGL